MGWGGIAVLWHPASFGSGWLDPQIGNTFWYLADHRTKWGDTWTSASNFIQLVRQRYAEVGLMPKEPSSAIENDVIPSLESFTIRDEVGPLLSRH
jgi:hypothetical protein